MLSGFKVERFTHVPAEQIYDRLADVASWSQWATTVSRSLLVQVGATDPLGAGAIRRMSGLRNLFTVDEEILAATRPSYQRYTVRGLPATDYVGQVHIHEDGGRTHILWTAEFRPKIAGTGWALGKFLGLSISRIADDLIAACERAAIKDV